MNETGALYIAWGADFVRMAARSAASLKRQHRDCPAALFTNAPPGAAVADFDTVEILPLARRGFLDKVTLLARSPFARTLYLDADTHICAPVEEIFDLLDRFDLAAAHAPLRITSPVPSVPASFPELNAGVIAFRRAPETAAFLASWLTAYERDLARGVWQQSDQPAFRETLFHSGLRLAVLPTEWNCRYNSPGYAEGPVRLLHGTRGDPESVAARINADTRQRVHCWIGDEFRVTPTTRPAPEFS